MDFRLRTSAAAQFLGMPRQHVAERCGGGTIPSIQSSSHRRIAPSELVKFATGSAEPHDNRVLHRHQPFITTLPINSPAVTAKARLKLTLAGNEYPQDWARTLKPGLGIVDVQTPRPPSAALRARSPFTEFSPTPPVRASFARNARTTSRTRLDLPTTQPHPLLHRLNPADHPNVAHTESRTPA